MNLAPLQVILYRDGPHTAWGFRLQGGSDLGVPLTIQRVSMGSPSEGELHRFDIISRIGNHEAGRMTHQQAHSAIKSAGNTLNMTVLRTGQSFPAHNSHHHSNQPSHYSVSPLPTTDFNDFSRKFVPGPAQNNPSAQNTESVMEREIERHQIVSQPHRTFPLITPSLKLKHDLPTGSYLRHVSDPFTKSRDHNSMKARVQESVLNAGAAYSAGSLSPARSATPEVFGQVGPNSGIVHRQYNSPIHLYSQQNVLDTISGQTGVTPNLGEIISEAVYEISNSPDLSARKGNDIMRFFDITKSPTYQAIYEQEWKTLRAEKLDEHKPVQNQVKVLPPPPVNHHQPHLPHNHGPVVNPFGTPKDKVLQSKSFDMIKNVLAGQTDF